MKKKLLVLIIFLILIIFLYGIYYVNDFSYADDTAQKYINGTDDVEVIEIENGMLLDGPGNDTALIFYPGAKVEYTSYLPFLTNLSSQGIDCFLVQMPFNLAILDENSADDIINSYNYSNYFMSGHSLGGVMASNYVNKTNYTNGLILIGSYSTVEIKKPVLSIIASEDKVLNLEKYNQSRLLIDNLTELNITGGNHAQIGNYGIQSGDGKANITPQSQQGQSVTAILDFIGKINQ